MKSPVVSADSKTVDRRVRFSLFGAFHSLARRAVFSSLGKLEYGRITVVDDALQYNFGTDGLRATVNVTNPLFYTDLAFGGSIGAAEAFMSGFWAVDDLTALIRIIVRNREAMTDLERGPAVIMKPIQALRHRRRRNTPRGSQGNIAAHYDLGNDFYGLWLDRTMTYSCNIFEREDSSLEEAAVSKYESICRKLGLKASDRVLEIGSGWGGFAIHAAQNYGCKITTTTISRQQYEYARERIRDEGLSNRIELLFEDYRELRGTYDKLASIEMIEAVGHHFLDTYLKVCSNRLKSDGLMALQAIVIEDRAYEAQIRNPDFIKRYIFPGSFIPSISAITQAVARNTDLRLFDLEDITPHYARTLREWRKRFFHNIEAVRKLGFPESFIRLWEYYFCYCEGGFLERYIGDVQMVFAKPGWRS